MSARPNRAGGAVLSVVAAIATWPAIAATGSAPLGIRILSAGWGATGGWGGERGVCDVSALADQRCALRQRCVLPTEPSPCPDPPQPLAGVERTLIVSYRCDETGRERNASAVAPDALLLRCSR